MKKLIFTVFVGFLGVVHADIVSVEGPHSYLYSMKSDMVISSSCPKYLNPGQLTIEQIREKCNKRVGERTQTHFLERLNAQAVKFYDVGSIMSSEQLEQSEQAIAELLDYDQRFGLDAEGKKKLDTLQTSVTKHYLNDRLKYDFDDQIKTVVDSIGIDNIVTLSGEFNVLKDLRITDDSLQCGVKGTMEEKIADCSKYSSLQVSKHKYITADYVNHKYLIINNEGELYSNFRSEFLLDYSNETPWRRISELERSKLPASVARHTYLTSALLNTNLTFNNTLARRRSNDKIEMILENGILNIVLHQEGKSEVIKQLNMPSLPVRMKDEYKDSRFERYKYVESVLEGHSDLNDGLIKGMNMGYLLLFPVPLAINAAYSTAYIPAFIMDIFSRDHRVYRKFKKLISGKKVKASKKDFEKLVQILRNL